MTATLPEVSSDLRALSDGELAALFDAGDAATRAAVMAELARQDQAADRRRKAQARRRAVESEWLDAAHAHYVAAEAATCGNLTAAGSTVGEPFPGLYRLSDRDFARQASEEMRNFCETNPRPTRAGFLRHAFAPRRGAYPWHEPGWKESTVDTTTTMAPAPVAAPGPPAPKPAAEAPPGAPGPSRADAIRARVDAIRADVERSREDQRERLAGAEGRAEAAAWRARVRAGMSPSQATRAQVPSAEVAGPGAAVAVADPAALLTRQAGPVVLVRQPQIDGARVLAQVHGFLSHFAVWPSDACLVAATGFIAQTHARDPKALLPVWPYSPRWLFLSAEAGSGKTWMARIMSKLVPGGQLLVEASKASLVQAIAEHGTPVVDESDVLFGTGMRNQGIRAILNAGYEPDQFTSRMQGRQKVAVPLFGPVILAGLDKLRTATGNDMKTLLSRCLIAHFQMAPEGYRPPRFDSQARAIAGLLNQRVAAWMAQEVAEGIGDEVPEVPPGLGNGPAALWEPLFTAADRAGGEWPELMRDACSRMESATGLPGDDETAAGRIDQWLDQWDAAGAGRPFLDAAVGM